MPLCLPLMVFPGHMQNRVDPTLNREELVVHLELFSHYFKKR